MEHRGEAVRTAEEKAYTAVEAEMLKVQSENTRPAPKPKPKSYRVFVSSNDRGCIAAIIAIGAIFETPVNTYFAFVMLVCAIYLALS